MEQLRCQGWSVIALEEKIGLSEYKNYNDAYAQLGRFLDGVYMHKPIHPSLGYCSGPSRA